MSGTRRQGPLITAPRFQRRKDSCVPEFRRNRVCAAWGHNYPNSQEQDIKKGYRCADRKVIGHGGKTMTLFLPVITHMLDLPT
jgi:hypothetical protein